MKYVNKLVYKYITKMLLTPDRSLALVKVISTWAVNDMFENRCILLEPNKIDLRMVLLTLRSGNHDIS